MTEEMAGRLAAIFARTRNGFESDYRGWGDKAAEAILLDPELTCEFVRREARAVARKQLTRAAVRTGAGLARVMADAASGQVSIWSLWLDPVLVRLTGERNVREGDKKMRLGVLQQQVADCMDMHGGISGRDAWIAEGFDPSELDAADLAAREATA